MDLISIPINTPLTTVCNPVNLWWPVYRDKGTPAKMEGGPVLLLQNYPHPLGLITSPLPLTLEPPEHDHHLPFYFFPLNKKET